MSPRLSPTRSSVVGALPVLVVALALTGCAGSSGAGENGSPTASTEVARVPALAKFVHDDTPLDVRLGAPLPEKVLEEFGPETWEVDEFARYGASALTGRLSGEVYRMRVFPSDAAAPVVAIEVTTTLALDVDPTAVLANAGVTRGDFAGTWNGIFRPVEGELYGSYVDGQ